MSLPRHGFGCRTGGTAAFPSVAGGGSGLAQGHGKRSSNVPNDMRHGRWDYEEADGRFVHWVVVRKGLHAATLHAHFESKETGLHLAVHVPCPMGRWRCLGTLNAPIAFLSPACLRIVCLLRSSTLAWESCSCEALLPLLVRRRSYGTAVPAYPWENPCPYSLPLLAPNICYALHTKHVRYIGVLIIHCKPAANPSKAKRRAQLGPRKGLGSTP